MNTTTRQVLEVSSKPVAGTITAVSLRPHFQEGEEQGDPLALQLFCQARLQLADQAPAQLLALPSLHPPPTITTCISLQPTPMAMDPNIDPQALTTDLPDLNTNLLAQTMEQVDPATGRHPHTPHHQI